MTQQHTPGPWYLAEYNDSNVRGGIGIFSNNAETPIVHSVMGESLEQSDANARLMAAAPELLAALRIIEIQADALVRAGFIGDGDAIAIRAAIAKVEGAQSSFLLP